VKAKASAPAKVILFGEHFVVFGKPAIVAAIDRRAYVTAEPRSDETIYVKSEDLNLSGFFHDRGFEAEEGGLEGEMKLKPIETVARRIVNLSGKKTGVTLDISSDIPVEAGLGSSAAVAVASASAVSGLVGLNLSKDDVFRFACDAERLIHGTPSGIDPAVSTYGGILQYLRDGGITHLNASKDLQLVIGDTGMSRSTGTLVAMVRDLRKRYPSVLDPILESAESIVCEAVKALEIGDLETLGELMNVDHGLLSAVGVCNEVLERLVYAAKMAGAYGAKLTGAGGGGCMVALAPHSRVESVVEAIRGAGGSAFPARIAGEGVRIET